jgi:hypothetical protein
MPVKGFSIVVDSCDAVESGAIVEKAFMLAIDPAAITEVFA